MVQRFVSTGSLPSSPSGAYVAYSEYEKLVALLAEALDDAQNYFGLLELGEVTAVEANAALRATVRLG